MQVILAVKTHQACLQIPIRVDDPNKQSSFLRDALQVIEKYGTYEVLHQYHERLSGMLMGIILEQKMQEKLRTEKEVTSKDYDSAAGSTMSGSPCSASSSMMSRISKMSLDVRKMFVNMHPQTQPRANTTPSKARGARTSSAPSTPQSSTEMAGRSRALSSPDPPTPKPGQMSAENLRQAEGSNGLGSMERQISEQPFSRQISEQPFARQISQISEQPFPRAVSDGGATMKIDDRWTSGMLLEAAEALLDRKQEAAQKKRQLEAQASAQPFAKFVSAGDAMQSAGSAPLGTLLESAEASVEQFVPATPSAMGAAGSMEDMSSSSCQLRDALEAAEQQLLPISEKSGEHPRPPPLEELPGLVARQ
eukprot:gb/GFBE01046502.1/.p1 GENE.gb/GFBE01046502.1/~~gb/GFBE01046502.1/.p1  ORF type:complete len:364 (+),score=70.98 gb/GFBE01046502.1/:1-1092(+)